MIKFYIEDTYPTYAIAFFKGGEFIYQNVEVPESEIDKFVFNFLPAEPKEQVFEWPS